ncbi:glycosyltransferase family 4 protein [uncultured Rhodoblastus sp.]|uniref:glycosyltransferase family 4 protein n=1 Tax=uncultured Rhodoblastus sp. TaxID=543037 RepID=UPI0025FDD4A7|nr:glycosyltransferase family 4 protein [uncultured Rhodoblastus sp.]
MGRLVFAIPGDISARTGGYGYDRRLLAELPPIGVEAVHLPLPGRFPDAGPQDVAAALAAMQQALQPGGALLIDGLAYGALPAEAIGALAAPVIALCHHPLCLETGLAPGRVEFLRQSERAALALARHVIVTSAHTAEILRRDFDIAPDRLTVAPPGTDRAPRARGSGGAPLLLAVGAIMPRKAFDVLVEALGGLTELDWRLQIVGSRALHPVIVAALEAQIKALGLESRIELAGEFSGGEIDAIYAASDIFVSASLFEGFGMALAEAMTRGLPILTTTGGAAAQTVPDAAALKVPPADVAALREALRRLLCDDGLRRRLAQASWRAGQGLPRWRESARLVAAVFRATIGG